MSDRWRARVAVLGCSLKRGWYDWGLTSFDCLYAKFFFFFAIAYSALPKCMYNFDLYNSLEVIILHFLSGIIKSNSFVN